VRWNSIQIVYNDYRQWQISLACLSWFSLTASCLFHPMEAEKENTYKEELVLLLFNYMNNNMIWIIWIIIWRMCLGPCPSHRMKLDLKHHNVLISYFFSHCIFLNWILSSSYFSRNGNLGNRPPMSIAALFTIRTKRRKQPKYLSRMSGWRKYSVHITVQCYSALKKKEILAFVTNVYESGRYCGKWNKASQTNIDCMDLIVTWNLKFSTSQKQRVEW